MGRGRSCPALTDSCWVSVQEQEEVEGKACRIFISVSDQRAKYWRAILTLQVLHPADVSTDNLSVVRAVDRLVEGLQVRPAFRAADRWRLHVLLQSKINAMGLAPVNVTDDMGGQGGDDKVGNVLSPC